MQKESSKIWVIEGRYFSHPYQAALMESMLKHNIKTLFKIDIETYRLVVEEASKALQNAPDELLEPYRFDAKKLYKVAGYWRNPIKH